MSTDPSHTDSYQTSAGPGIVLNEDGWGCGLCGTVCSHFDTDYDRLLREIATLRAELEGMRASLDAETRRADDNDDARLKAEAERDRLISANDTVFVAAQPARPWTPGPWTYIAEPTALGIEHTLWSEPEGSDYRTRIGQMLGANQGNNAALLCLAPEMAEAILAWDCPSGCTSDPGSFCSWPPLCVVKTKLRAIGTGGEHA